MRLIGLAVVLTVSLTLAPLAVEGQPPGKVYRVGLFAITPVAAIVSDATHPVNSGFRREMRDRGYVEGQNILLELRALEGRMERASEVVAELVRLNMDVIVTATPEMTPSPKERAPRLHPGIHSASAHTASAK
jgi:putative ABC transport system substrate-binding protein